MTPIGYVKDAATSVGAAPRTAIRGVLVGVGSAWTIIEPASWFFGWVDEKKSLISVFAIAIVVVGWVRSVHEPRLRRLSQMGTTFEVTFGDLFSAHGLRVIAVNDFFDSKLGERVAVASLHGQLIAREFAGDSARFRDAVDPSLANASGEQVERKSGRKTRYRVGQTATIEPNHNKYVLVALGRTDISTSKVSATIADLTTALGDGWTAARSTANGEAVVCPLIGAGLAGVNMAPQQLATLILASALEASGAQKVSHTIRIVLPNDQYGHIRIDQLFESLEDRS